MINLIQAGFGVLFRVVPWYLYKVLRVMHSWLMMNQLEEKFTSVKINLLCCLCYMFFFPPVIHCCSSEIALRVNLRDS